MTHLTRPTHISTAMRFLTFELAFQGQKPEETPAVNPGDAKASEPTSPPKGVSTDIHRNYAVVAGAVTGLSALGWYLLSKDKKTEELLD